MRKLCMTSLRSTSQLNQMIHVREHEVMKLVESWTFLIARDRILVISHIGVDRKDVLVRHLLYWLTETPLELWSNVLTESEWWREGWCAGFFPVMAYSFVCYPITNLNLFALDFQRRYAIRWCLNLRSLLPVSLMKEILEELSCHIYSWWLSITPLIGQTRARMAENTSPGLVWRCFCAPFSILAVTFDPSVNTMQITSIWKACFGAHVAGN
jgi:hypothetical protein